MPESTDILSSKLSNLIHRVDLLEKRVFAQSTWHPLANYDPNWSGTLRFKLLDQAQTLMLFEGVADPSTMPLADTVVPLGFMNPPFVPAKIIRVPILVEQVTKKGAFASGGSITFDSDGSLQVVFAVDQGDRFVLCATVPLD